MDLQQPKVFIISAPSGAGKTTLVHKVLEGFDVFEFSVSATTRLPRGAEQDGVDYHFLSLEDFLTRREKGEFLETEEVYTGTWYGTLKSEVDRIIAKGKHPIFDVDVVGGLNIKRTFGDQAVAIFIQPPSLETLKDRLTRRGTDSPEAIGKRYAKAAREMTYAPRFDHIIINDDLDTATAQLRQLIQANLHEDFKNINALQKD